MAAAVKLFPDIELDITDPAVKEAKELVFYGLSGAPPTIAHGAILGLLAELFPASIILLVPTSNLSGKASVTCTADYRYKGQDLRLAMQAAMIRSLKKPNIRISLHEQRIPGGLPTFQSIQQLQTTYNKPIRVIWGEDSVDDIATRRWSNAKALANMIKDGKILVSYIPRSKETPTFKEKFMGPACDPKKWYDSADQDRTPFSEGEAETIVKNIINIAHVAGDRIKLLQVAEGVSSSKVRAILQERAEGNLEELIIPEVIVILEDYQPEDLWTPYSLPECEEPKKGGRRTKITRKAYSRSNKNNKRNKSYKRNKSSKTRSRSSRR